jgi:replicative DNA helicase
MTEDVRADIVDRIPPHSIELEQQVLGAMLLSKSAAGKAAALIDEQSFYRGKHREIFRAVVGLLRDGGPIDLPIIAEALDKRGVLEEVGGAAYLADVAAAVGTSVNVEHHARLLIEKAVRRAVIAKASEVVATAFEQDDDIYDVIERHMADLYQLGTSSLRGTSTAPLHDVAADVLQRFDLDESQGLIETGFLANSAQIESPFDKLLGGGLARSETHIIGGQSQSGKTSLTVQMAYSAAQRGVKVAYMPIEGGRASLINRLAQQLSHASERTADKAEREEHRAALAQIAEGRLPFVVDDFKHDRSDGITTNALRSHVGRIQNTWGLDLLIVDHLKQFDADPRHHWQSAERTLREINNIAVQFEIAIVLLHHLTMEYNDCVLHHNTIVMPEITDFGIAPSSIQDLMYGVFVLCNPHAGTAQPRRKVALLDDREDDWGNTTEGRKRCAIKAIKYKSMPAGRLLPMEWRPNATAFHRWEQSMNGND